MAPWGKCLWTALLLAMQVLQYLETCLPSTASHLRVMPGKVCLIVSYLGDLFRLHDEQLVSDIDIMHDVAIAQCIACSMPAKRIIAGC